jgi:hypothetical protein
MSWSSHLFRLPKLWFGPFSASRVSHNELSRHPSLSAGPFVPRRFGILPRCGPAATSSLRSPCFVRSPANTSMCWRSPRCCSPCGGVRRIRLTHVLARHRRVRRASPTATLRLLPSLRPCRYIRVSAFGRFDAILDRVEKTSALTLPDCRPLLHPYGNLRSNHASPTTSPLMASSLGAIAQSPSSGVPL